MKYREQWTGKLPSRLHVLSNGLPKLGDASTAIVGRIVLLLTTRSWLGHEDHSLEPALQTELTGILNWALVGLHRLAITNDNCFTRLPAADEAIIAMRDLASPVAAFARDRCVINPRAEVGCDDLYARYRAWAEDNGHHRAAKTVFGRDLRAAVLRVMTKTINGPASTPASDGRMVLMVTYEIVWTMWTRLSKDPLLALLVHMVHTKT